MPVETVIAGRARLGRRTKALVGRLQPGDVAIIDHPDLDRISAEDLVASGAAAVVNASPSSTGAYPNTGPLIVVEAGLALVDVTDADPFALLREGDEVELHGGALHRAGEVVAEGAVRDPDSVRDAHARHREAIGDALRDFARNTLEHMVGEEELLSGELELPRLATDFRDRPALIVIRGSDHRRDLHALRPFIGSERPVLVGVDGGADAILEAGLHPDVIVGDMDSASETALACGAELVVHAYADGRAPGRERLERLALPHTVVPAPGTSQDAAMLIAAEKGAELIVSVGTQFSLVEFLDKSRRGMSSTFLTRLRLGERLVDAKGLSRLMPSPEGGAGADLRAP